MSFRANDEVPEALRRRTYQTYPNPIYEMGSSRISISSQYLADMPSDVQLADALQTVTASTNAGPRREKYFEENDIRYSRIHRCVLRSKSSRTRTGFANTGGGQ